MWTFFFFLKWKNESRVHVMRFSLQNWFYFVEKFRGAFRLLLNFMKKKNNTRTTKVDQILENCLFNLLLWSVSFAVNMFINSSFADVVFALFACLSAVNWVEFVVANWLESMEKIQATTTTLMTTDNLFPDGNRIENSVNLFYFPLCAFAFELNWYKLVCAFLFLFFLKCREKLNRRTLKLRRAKRWRDREHSNQA